MKKSYEIFAYLLAGAFMSSCSGERSTSTTSNFNRSLKIWKPEEYRRSSDGQHVLATVSASGQSAPASPPQAGRRGSDGSWSGGHGAPGSDGSKGRDGQDAEDIQAQIRVNQERPGTFIVEVPRTRNSNKGVYELDPEQPKFLVLAANGGRGQPGSSGGAGGDGSEGAPAPFPVFEGQQTFGESGGDGGDAGEGGDGGDGGDAGQVTIQVPENILESLWHVRAETNGAPGGDGGPGGYGGNAGSGGRPPFFQRITVGTRWETVTRTRVNEQGETEYYDEEVAIPQYAYRNPGPDGRSGRSGESGSSGANGRSHTPTIEVTKNGSVVGTYNQLFEISLSSVNLGQSVDDGILEPGEFVWVDQLEYKNIHQMPSPKKETLLTVLEEGGISVPNDPIVIKDPGGFSGFESRKYEFEPFQHFFQLADPTKTTHQNFFREINKADIAKGVVAFQPAIQIGNSKMALTGSKSFVIQSPVAISHVSEFGTHKYPIVAGEDTETQVALKLSNRATKPYGKMSNFKSLLPGGKQKEGSRRVLVKLTYLKDTEDENYLNNARLATKIMLDEEEVASSVDLAGEPVMFELEKIEAMDSKNLELSVDIWDDNNLEPGSTLNLSVEVYLSGLPGEEPTKLVQKEKIQFVYSLYYKFEADKRLVAYNKQVRCFYPNLRGKKWRVLDRLYVTKTYNQNHASDPANLEWVVQSSITGPFAIMSPSFAFDINGMLDFYNAFLEPKSYLSSSKIIDLMNEEYVPELKRRISAGAKNYIERCEKIPERRLGPIDLDWLFYEIMPREFRDHIMLPAE